ncbi:MAG: GEVED domain-containing protein, partial [Bacteroidota bacterium]
STTVQFFIYNNSIYLTGSGGGNNFGSSGIHLNSGPAVTLVNNLVINLINPGSAGHTVAYRRSSSTLTSYQAASNNNLFYAGTPAASRLIYAEGVTTLTNAQQTIAGFRTYVGPTRDANSQTEAATPFVSVATDSLLHIAATPATFVESGGKPYPSPALTTDIDGQTRNAIAPDIGADEGNFTNLLPQILSYSATPATGQCTVTSHTVNATTSTSVTSATLNYAFNGVAQTAISMTGGAGVWSATIPAASPANANVTWSITATDGTYSVSSTGTAYQDEYLSANTLTAAVAPVTVCAGQPISLSAYLGSLAPAPTTYGASNATTTADEEILNVTFKTINQSSPCGTLAPGAGSLAYQYSNYTSVPAPLIIAGETVSFSITLGSCPTSAFTNRAVIYIDWNRNGLFTEANEVYAEPAGVTGPHVWTGTITVPTTLSFGLTRMRVIVNEVGTITPPTGTYSWGETEDYTLQLAGGAGFTYAWTDGTGAITPVSGSYTPSTAGTYNYQVTGTDPNGCTVVSSPVVVTVNAIPADPTLTASSQCGNGVPPVRASGGTAYNWYLNATGGTPIQSSPVDSLTSYSISTTTTFHVAAVNPLTGCESNRVPVVATVIQPDAISASASSSPVCPGTLVTLTATQTGSSNNYVFNWVGNGLNSNSGAVVTANPTVAGANVYTVTAIDAAAGCVTTATVTVTGNVIPVSVVATASPANVCLGASVNLSGGPGGSLSTTYASSNATTTADDEIFNVTITGTSLNNSSDCSTIAPGPGSSLRAYANYTTSVTAPVLLPGNSYSGSLTIGQCGTFAYTCGFAIFIDLNRNGLFEIPAERVAAGPNVTAAVAGTVFPFSFTVPSTASSGTTLMRVVAVESANGVTGGINPTGTYSYGETED